MNNIGSLSRTDTSAGLQKISEVLTEKQSLGITQQNGQVPDAPSAAGESLTKALARLLPKISDIDLDAVLLDLTTELKELVNAAETDKLTIAEREKSTALHKKKEQLDEATKKTEEAIKERESASIWDKIALAFKALGAVLSIALGALVSVIPGAQALGALMIVGGVIGVVSVIDSALKMATGMGIAGNIAYAQAKSEGLSETEAKKVAGDADLGFSVALAVAGIAVGIATVAVNPAAVTTLAMSIVNIVSTVSGILGAASDIGASVTRYQASETQSESLEIQADTKKSEAFLQVLEELIDQILSQISKNSSIFTQIIGSIATDLQERGQVLSRAKFSA